ncbi:MAG: hypothetical protein GHCLOJNM_01386 [bacterium]|nr:hypothetical protein [bacterium]
MPKATCQLNLTLEVPVAEHVEQIARSVHLTPSGAGRVLLQQRLALEESGWRLENKEVEKLLNAVSRLNGEQIEALRDFLTKTAPEAISI